MNHATNAGRTGRVAVALALLPFFLHAVPLFENGRSVWTVVTETNALSVVYAAEEFTNAVFRTSGASLPVADAAKGPAVRIRVKADGQKRDGICVRRDGRDLVLAGNNPRAALHATYWFLQKNSAFPTPSADTSSTSSDGKTSSNRIPNTSPRWTANG